MALLQQFTCIVILLMSASPGEMMYVMRACMIKCHELPSSQAKL